jgi:hypothetical protein
MLTVEELEEIVKDLLSSKALLPDERQAYTQGIVDMAEELQGRGLLFSVV